MWSPLKELLLSRTELSPPPNIWSLGAEFLTQNCFSIMSCVKRFVLNNLKSDTMVLLPHYISGTKTQNTGSWQIYSMQLIVAIPEWK